MIYLIVAGVLFIALAGMCPGPPAPASTKGCRCSYCAWYIHKRDYCSDPYPHRRPRLGCRWSLQSAEELVEIWGGEIDDTAISRSLAFVEEEHHRSMIDDLKRIKPMTTPGPIHYLNF